jgi:hypothetical protein
MKKLILLIAICLSSFCSRVIAQDGFGNTLNLGVGVGYPGYVGHAVPAFNLSYEFGLPHNFTLAPFVGIYSYQNNMYWGDAYTPYRNYSYTETVVPVGGKLAYYFNQLFQAGPRWDFYGALSLGFSFRTVVWENGYYGDRTLTNDASPMYVNLHAGARYYMTDRAGLFLDLSTGTTTFGLSLNFRNRGTVSRY